MSSIHVRRGDTVAVIAGRERGKRGKVLRVLQAEGRVLVEKINMIKKHQRPTQQGGVAVPGGILAREAPIHVSNVMIVCKECTKPARTGIRARADGVKVRVCKRCGADID